MSNNQDAILQIKGLSKSFPGVKALQDVDFTLRRGEIHALMGQNGAGKSTLIKVMTGLYKKDTGEMLLEGQPFEFGSPEQAPKHGISTVYQEVNLIPHLSVAENIYLGRQPKRFGAIDWPTLNRRAEEAVKKLDLDIDVTQPVSSYSIAIQQLVAIIRALDIQARILILDEPTSSLDAAETERLFTVLKKLKSQGIAIVFVTHFLGQVYEISDTITVLRNGKLVGEKPVAELPKLQLIEMMLGKSIESLQKADKKAPKDCGTGNNLCFLRAQGLGRKGAMSPFNLVIRKGEVMGLAGLLGSGRTETARLLFGVDKAQQGNLYINDKSEVLNSPRKAIAHRFGLCPEDRKSEGIIEDLSVRENIILALQARSGIFNKLSPKRQSEIVDKYIKMLDIKASSQNQKVGDLSGGNQQKVIVARWLASDPEFLILDEPTRGIDVGAKAEIEKLIVELSRAGMAVLFISSELEEIISCADRVAVLRDREVVDEISGDEIEESKIMKIIAQGGKQ
ncbi:sugar ABC transporter ATP-binding protein [Pseudodesulfovibrio indicus]|uniref:Monosaccharide ABC transporter ATP-binding protein (CUT2 family) n=1 Tax=Pseudodesulfovibrio indicus TaxID=1716143 RepID=A0A126QS30_9BACT|nr:sugar ABC transporter ATP-binding protein [Pseudodesulfovibrio indicus]AMK12516.1 sugar ABC transporter ATP-binding protein [Pseudodesulfovibrio indicus]TDT90826.1 monosaccharide ABC transporter ATP-binding protein (CUT2 family) [Pseudodesulfovibrio indicus]